jgi:2-dehydropantoate 2-reductase
MKIAILGAGAMGSAIGALLHESGHDVTLLEISPAVIEAVRANGLLIENKAGERRAVPIRITNNPAEVGQVELLIVFVKCYHTAAAVRNAHSLIGPDTTVLSLQNGWGNGPRIAEIVGREKVVLGVCYHSATVLAPGRVLHAGMGKTFLGELDGSDSDRLRGIVKAFTGAGMVVEPSGQVLKEIWSKLALNAVTLPTSATIGVTAERLLDTTEMRELMQSLLREVVAVANAQGIPLEFEERWKMISGLLGGLAPNTKGSMLQDIEARRTTEIDVINGAIANAGREHSIPTPANDAMVALVKALEASFAK